MKRLVLTFVMLPLALACAQEQLQLASSGAPAALASIRAMSVAAAPASAPVYTLRRDVNEVRVEFVATDRAGRSIEGLDRSQVRVLDSGVPIETFTDFRKDDSRPLRLALMIDTSGSTAAQLELEKRFSRTFLQSVLRDDDRAMLASFDSTLQLLSSFGDEQVTMERGLDAVKPGSLTAFHDAVAQLCDSQFRQDAGLARKVLVIFTDGNDTLSRRTEAEMTASAVRAGVAVYSITVAGKREWASPSKPLARLTRATGGRSFAINKAKELELVLRQMENELRQRYVLTYSAKAVPGFHALQVTLAGVDAEVRARQGYFRSE